MLQQVVNSVGPKIPRSTESSTSLPPYGIESLDLCQAVFTAVYSIGHGSRFIANPL
jgi:hypothetical protein